MGRWMTRRRLFRVALVIVLALVVITGAPVAWLWITAAGHLYDEAELAQPGAPRADVVLVLGAEVEQDGTPKPFLRGRLDTTAALVRAGYARVVVVSGDGHGESGDETTAMRRYLITRWGIPTSRIVVDPDGLDTYDSCLRAKQVYGVDRALIVTQPFHLARAVGLCRTVGIDADGVGARCDCLLINQIRNAGRDYLAATKAGWDAGWGRDSAVRSPPSTAVTDAVAASPHPE